MSVTYPVRVEGRLEPGLSRWLWLVKWVLAIPHFVLLAFLWVAFAALSVVAFFAILFTGRYPRAIFDFNVGVLRWTWRVSYYTYGALGTDRYPPFSLGAEPDYPATLDIAYPQHLSRGLVLVKWWLLALPHYLILGVLMGTGWVAWQSEGWRWSGGSLLTLLVVIAGFVLLFTGRYPQGIFDIALGINRWWLRVAAYAALMTDAYPPFRFDTGGHDPATIALSAPAAPPAPPLTGAPGPAYAPGAPPPPQPPGWSGGRVVSVVAGALAGFLALGLGAGGAYLLWLDQVQRDDTGFVMTEEREFSTPTYAVTAERFEIIYDGSTYEWGNLLGDVRLAVRATGEDELFVGLGPQAQVSAYLAGVEHERVLRVDDADRVRQQFVAGDRRPAPPDEHDFWVASASGTGEQSLVWTPREGRWAIVVMNADGTPGVAAQVAAGGEAPWLQPLALGLLAGAAVVAVAAVVLVAVPVARAGRR